jgi:release factor glutamine methyltransferase
VTLAEVLSAATRRLEAAGIEDARLEAELLLRHLLSLDTAALYARLRDELPAPRAARYDALVEHRLKHAPSAYTTGVREFYGLDIEVTPDVMIPRPETELLVDVAIELAKPRSRIRRGAVIADVGTGSGAVAVALALNVPRSTVYAIDCTAEIIAVAAANAARHGVSDRVMCLRGDLLSPLPEYVDVIVANLPYVKTSDWAVLPPEIRDHEPRLALDGGDDGLDVYRRFLVEAPAYLRPNGALCFEIGYDQAEAAAELARGAFPDNTVSLREDFGHYERVVVVTPTA